MRLWPLAILDQLPRQQLLGQHRECCALRGKGWGRKHATVDYVFRHTLGHLYEYHRQVLGEMVKRGYGVDPHWYNRLYRGKRIKPALLQETGIYVRHEGDRIYPEHDTAYLDACIANLAAKGVKIDRKKAMRKINPPPPPPPKRLAPGSNGHEEKGKG